MHKFYRSVLLTGMVAVGLAGCGDDVTVVQPPDPPPPPAPTVKSISVAPNPGTVAIGGTITMSAAVVADAGVATTVTWSSSDQAKATVNATSGVVTGMSAGSVAITATSTVNPAVQGNATVNVTAAPTATVTGVTVTPGTAGLVVGQTVQLSASVQGTNNPAQTVTWSSLSGGIASVSAGGLVTGVANGTAVIRGCSSATGFTNVCGSMSVTVTTPSPASVSIQSLTTGGLGTPVVLNNVFGQIEATINVDGGDQTLDRVDVLVGGVVIASQSFAVTPAPAEASAEGAPVTVVLSFNTTQLRQVNGVFIPVIFNGQKAITANLYVVGSGTPLASNAIPVVMNNPDAAIAPASLNTAAGALSFTNSNPSAGTVWYKSNLSTSFTYLSYSTIAPTSVTVTLNGACGTAAGSMAGTAGTGLVSTRTWTCAATEASRSITGMGAVTYPAGSVGPDGSNLVAAAGFSTVGGQFTVAGDARWNVITPTPNPLPGPVFVDNLGPAVTVNPIGFHAGGIALGDVAPNNCEETGLAPGCWVGNSYDLLGDFSQTDGGSGVDATTRSIFARSAAVCTANTFTIAGATENTSPAAYDVCYEVADNLGNLSGKIAGFNVFGVDKTPPTLTYTGTYDPGVGTVNPKVVNAVPAQVLNYSITDNNSGIDGTNNTGIKVTRTNLLNNGGTVSSTACPVPNTALDGVAPAPQSLNAPYAPDNACNLPGQYIWTAMGYDRAGNSAGPIVRQMEYNPGGSNISLIAAVGSYAPSVAAKMNVWADDDEDITGYGFDYQSADEAGNTYWWSFGPWTGGTPNIDATTFATAGSYPGIGGFGFGALGQSWDNILNLSETQVELTLPGAWVLRGFVHNASPTDLNQFRVFGSYIFDSWEQRTSEGWYGNYSYDSFNVPSQLRTAYTVSTNPWTAPRIANILNAALVNISGRCTLEWTTLTNAPTIITRVWGHDNGVVIRDVSANPTLVSDNGIQRIYRLQLDATNTCAQLYIDDVLAIDGDVGLYLIGNSPGGGGLFAPMAPFAASMSGDRANRGKNLQ